MRLVIMLSSPSLDQLHLVLADRLAEAQHAALVRQALRAGGPARPAPARLRLRMASLLRTLACRIDASLALPA